MCQEISFLFLLFLLCLIQAFLSLSSRLSNVSQVYVYLFTAPKSVFMCVMVFSPICPSIFGALYVESHYFLLSSSLCLYPRFFYPLASFPLMLSSLWFGVAISMAVSFSLILSPLV